MNLDTRKDTIDIFKMYDSLGLPFDIIFSFLKDHNAPCDMYKCFINSQKAGWTYDLFRRRTRDDFFDVYGKEETDLVFNALDITFMELNKEGN